MLRSNKQIESIIKSVLKNKNKKIKRYEDGHERESSAR